jgi:hypothetical protein
MKYINSHVLFSNREYKLPKYYPNFKRQYGSDEKVVVRFKALSQHVAAETAQKYEKS